ncbi:hypothetical protein V7654_17130, partial [Bacillus sp. JJ1609]|uniref:hypothetical protein n=1 Tax=Bacillus sp. JJ1609 TaxID=3122977 RepID=UPI002FFDBD32
GPRTTQEEKGHRVVIGKVPRTTRRGKSLNLSLSSFFHAESEHPGVEVNHYSNSKKVNETIYLFHIQKKPK